MKVELLAICDAATDIQGRLNILGVFEGIAAPKTPVTRDRCTLVTRMRFFKDEAGSHEMAIRFRNAKGVQMTPEMKAKFAVKISGNRKSVAVNMILNINQIKIPEFGEHEIALFLDETFQSSIPLIVARSVKNRVQGTMDN
jgi:hypothetical protein